MIEDEDKGPDWTAGVSKKPVVEIRKRRRLPEKPPEKPPMRRYIRPSPTVSEEYRSVTTIADEIMGLFPGASSAQVFGMPRSSFCSSPVDKLNGTTNFVRSNAEDSLTADKMTTLNTLLEEFKTARTHEALGRSARSL